MPPTGDPSADEEAGCTRPTRLLKHADFERVYKQGKRQFSPLMTVFYLARPQSGARVGFTVSKALGGAVDRNRMKRRLREAVRLQGGPLRAEVDVVINPKKTLRTAEFGQIVKEVSAAFALIEKKLGGIAPKV